MIVSVNWLKKYIDIDISVEELATLIGARLVEVEDVKSLAPKFKDVVIAQVILAQKIEGSDHLYQALIDDDGVVEGVERDENGYVQVVCGASNVRSGMKVVWLPPESIVPSTYGTPQAFKLEARKIMGVKSNGMIASARELDLYDEHDGILEVSQDIDPGSYFMDVFELNDHLLDIENKSLTHRPDTFGVIGFAREIAGILGKQFKTPGWLVIANPKFPKGSLDAPTVRIDALEAAENYELIVADGNFSEAKTPDEIKSYLSRVGVRPINAVVDATNYMMLVTGQPLHAFDYDKLIALCGGQPTISVRYAKDGETLETLDDRTLTLDEKDIVITANDTVIALAGAIGGKETAVDDTTKSVALESATFNLYNLRGTQMRHGIFSEAITRFTKGQPAKQNAPVLAATLALLDKWAGVSNVSAKASAVGEQKTNEPIAISASEINNILATNYSSDQIKEILEKIEFKVEKRKDVLVVTAPWWRKDISIKEDIIEEVGRLCGYDNIPLSLPSRTFRAVAPIQFDQFKKELRNQLSGSGANEVLTYSFVPGALIDQADQDRTNAYKIVNSISPELEYYRLSLMPSLLRVARTNLKQGFNEFALFELNKVHAFSRGLTEDSVPIEGYNLAGVVYHKQGVGGAEYYQAKKIVDTMLTRLNIKLEYIPLDLQENSLSMFTPFEPKRSAMLKDSKTGELVGVVGEYKNTIAKKFKLPKNIAGFEINLLKLFEIYQLAPKSSYFPLSKYPAVERDLCFKSKSKVSYAEIIQSIKNITENLEGIKVEMTPVDIYSSEDKTTKNTTVHLTLHPYDNTLSNDKINKILEEITSEVNKKTESVVV